MIPKSATGQCGYTYGCSVCGWTGDDPLINAGTEPPSCRACRLPLFPRELLDVGHAAPTRGQVAKRLLSIADKMQNGYHPEDGDERWLREAIVLLTDQRQIFVDDGRIFRTTLHEMTEAVIADTETFKTLAAAFLLDDLRAGRPVTIVPVKSQNASG